MPDLITTGPKVFEFFVGQEFFAAMPSPRLVPLVLGLVARVSPLLQARSARQWALWLARVWDSGSPVLAAIRKRTPAHMIGIQTPAPAGPAYDPLPAGGDDVPVRHFGLVLDMGEWQALADRLVAAGTKFVIEPHVRFKGQVGEQATMFFLDPSGNALEFKSFADMRQVFAK